VFRNALRVPVGVSVVQTARPVLPSTFDPWGPSAFTVLPGQSRSFAAYAADTVFSMSAAPDTDGIATSWTASRGDAVTLPAPPALSAVIVQRHQSNGVQLVEVQTPAVLSAGQIAGVVLGAVLLAVGVLGVLGSTARRAAV
jgi:hypothetical protein